MEALPCLHCEQAFVEVILLAVEAQPKDTSLKELDASYEATQWLLPRCKPANAISICQHYPAGTSVVCSYNPGAGGNNGHPYKASPQAVSISLRHLML